MKKLLLLTFVFTLFACSGGDDDNSNNQVSINEDLVGVWSGTITDSDGTGSTADQTLTFVSNGTCAVFNDWDTGETYSATGTWSSTESTVTVNWDAYANRTVMIIPYINHKKGWIFVFTFCLLRWVFMKECRVFSTILKTF